MITKNKPFGYIFNEASANVSEVEVVESGKRVVAKGVLQTGNQTNRNGRVYRTVDLAREINDKRQKELLKTGNMLGEAGHPITKDLLRQQTIDPKCACVRYLEFWMDGDNVMGKFKGTNNELGEAFDQDLREGVLPAFSFRALGTVTESAEGSVVTNLKMITYDYVIYPSHPTAYTVGLVSESAGNGGVLHSNVAKILNENAEYMNATKSMVCTFNNGQVVNMIKNLKESGAIDYIKDTSHNYSLIKECFDITKGSNYDLSPDGKMMITESGVGTIVMDVEDYIMKEIMTYGKR